LKIDQKNDNLKQQGMELPMAKGIVKETNYAKGFDIGILNPSDSTGLESSCKTAK